VCRCNLLVKHLRVAARLDDVVGEVDEELGQAALSCGVVAQNRGEGGITERLRKALAKSLASTSIVAQARYMSVAIPSVAKTVTHTEESTERRA
jgi:hypothetical protein